MIFVRESAISRVRRVGLTIAVGAAVLISSIPFLSAIAGATLVQNSHVSVCERSEKVRAAIVEESGVTECGETTPLLIRDITNLDLSDQEIANLSVGDFEGLHRLGTLDLSGNSLTSLPSGLFDDLFSLKVLRLHNNQLNTLQTDIFDELFLLEELTLHDNQITALPGGMFGDLSRFKGVLTGDEATGLDRIRRFLSEHEVETVEEFIDALPQLHKERFVFVYDSGGLGAEFVSSEHPRIISWGADAQFVFAWQTNPNASDTFRNSVEFLVPGQTRWTAGLIDFSGDAPEIQQPQSCQACHGSQSKPLWPGYFWEGSELVGPSTTRSDREIDEAMTALLASTNPKIALLDLEGSGFSLGYGRRLLKADAAKAPFLHPASELSASLAKRHAEILLERLKADNDYASFAENVVCSSNPEAAVRAPFLESREYTLGVLPYSDTLAGSGRESVDGNLSQYNFFSGTMAGTLSFLILHDMWETHSEVRRVYQETSNQDVVNSSVGDSAGEEEWYLVYPYGRATAEDELVQLYRLFFGYGSEESIAIVDAANPGIPHYGHFIGEFRVNQIESMAPKVCQALRGCFQSIEFVLTYMHDTKTIPQRPNRRTVGCSSSPTPSSQARGTTTYSGPAGGAQRHLVCASERMPMADAPARSATLADSVQILPQVDDGWNVGKSP